MNTFVKKLSEMRTLLFMFICFDAMGQHWNSLDKHPIEKIKSGINDWDEVICEAKSPDTFHVSLRYYNSAGGVFIEKLFAGNDYCYFANVFVSIAGVQNSEKGSAVHFSNGVTWQFPDIDCEYIEAQTDRNYVIACPIQITEDQAKFLCQEKITKVVIGNQSAILTAKDQKFVCRSNAIIWNRSSIKP